MTPTQKRIVEELRLADGFVATEALTAAIWPGMPAVQRRNSLEVTISTIRKKHGVVIEGRQKLGYRLVERGA